MFSNCPELQIDDSEKPFDVKKVTNFAYMFSGCQSIESLPSVAGFDMRSAYTVRGMFENCSSLSSIQVGVDNPSYVAQNVVDASSMFHGCESLTSVAIPFLNGNNVTTYSKMF